MAVCCLPGLSLLTARLPALWGPCRSPVPGHLPGAPLCVGMGALLKKAVGTLSLAWPTSGDRERPQAWDTGLSLPGGSAVEAHTGFRCRQWLPLTLPGCLLWVWPRDWGTGRQPCGFCSALLGDFRGLFTVGWLEKVMGDPAASIPTSVLGTRRRGGGHS